MSKIAKFGIGIVALLIFIKIYLLLPPSERKRNQISRDLIEQSKKLRAWDEDEKRDLIKQAIEISPNLAELYYFRAMFEKKKKKNVDDQIIKDLSKAIELDPSNVQYRFDRGRIYFAKKQFDSAYSDLEIVCAKNKNNREMLYYKAASGLKVKNRNDKQIAMDFYDVYKMDESDEDILKLLVNYLGRINQKDPTFSSTNKISKEISSMLLNKTKEYSSKKEISNFYIYKSRTLRVNPNLKSKISNFYERMKSSYGSKKWNELQLTYEGYKGVSWGSSIERVKNVLNLDLKESNDSSRGITDILGVNILTDFILIGVDTLENSNSIPYTPSSVKSYKCKTSDSDYSTPDTIHQVLTHKGEFFAYITNLSIHPLDTYLKVLNEKYGPCKTTGYSVDNNESRLRADKNIPKEVNFYNWHLENTDIFLVNFKRESWEYGGVGRLAQDFNNFAKSKEISEMPIKDDKITTQSETHLIYLKVGTLEKLYERIVDVEKQRKIESEQKKRLEKQRLLQSKQKLEQEKQNDLSRL